jgi:predicted kinase
MTDALARVLVLTGAPGVGKSTIAAALAARLERSAHVKADDVHRMIVRGGSWPSAGTPDASRQLLLRTRNAVGLAANFRDLGINVILDEVIASREQLDVVDDGLPRDLMDVVVLAADTATILARDAARSKQTAANYAGIDALIRETIGDRGIVVDTAQLSVSDTVTAVQALLPMWPWV